MDRRVYTFEDVDLHRETPKAYHCEIGESLFWVPKSQVKECDFETGHLVTTMWWAQIDGAREAYEVWIEEREREQEQTRRWYQERARQQEERSRQQTATTIQLIKSLGIYRKLALKYHPDKNPDTAEVMRDLNELWQAILADLKKVQR
jgi:hypothetical protein